MASEGLEFDYPELVRVNRDLVKKIKDRLDRPQNLFQLTREELEQIDVQLTVLPILLAKARELDRKQPTQE